MVDCFSITTVSKVSGISVKNRHDKKTKVTLKVKIIDCNSIATKANSISAQCKSCN